VKLWWRRVACSLGWDGNPLRRGSDKAEAMAMTLLVVALFIAGPLLAVLVGSSADAAAVREQHSERSWQQVQAVLRQGADQVVAGSGEWDIAWVQASWKLPDGRPGSGQLGVPLNARAGQRVWIWVTPAGQITRPPLTSADVVDQVTFATLMVIACWAALLGIGALAVRTAANRRRMAGWQREWEVSGPQWLRHR
jgi:hypothetical protein